MMGNGSSTFAKRGGPPPPSVDNAVSPSTLAMPPLWAAMPDATLALGHTVPHHVVPQLLRPVVGAWLPDSALRLTALDDAQCCVTALRITACDGSTCPALEAVTTLPYLTSLDIRAVAISPQTIALLSDLPDLRVLSVACRGCADPDSDAALLEQICLLSRLESLTLRGVNLDHDACQRLARLTELQSLRLNNCPTVDSRGLAQIAQQSCLEEVIFGSDCVEPSAYGFAVRLSRPELLAIKVHA